MVLKKTIEALKFDKDNAPSIPEEVSKDRLFFHDLINLTHGLSLFLNQKKIQKDSLEGHELDLVIKEIKTLQSLARDHFDFYHKNLTDTLKWVPSKVMLANLEHLSSVYLPQEKITWTLKNDASEAATFYFPLFYRAANNMIKNISEARGENIEIKLSINTHEMILETVNTIKPSQKSLELIILDETKKQHQGLGLDSIDQMAHAFGGEFQFEILEGKWCNKLVLPSQEFYLKGAKKAS